MTELIVMNTFFMYIYTLKIYVYIYNIRLCQGNCFKILGMNLVVGYDFYAIHTWREGDIFNITTNKQIITYYKRLHQCLLVPRSKIVSSKNRNLETLFVPWWSRPNVKISGKKKCRNTETQAKDVNRRCSNHGQMWFCCAVRTTSHGKKKH